MGIAASEGKYQLHEEDKLLSFDLNEGNGSHGMSLNSFNIHRIVDGSLKKILHLKSGNMPVLPRICFPYLSTQIKPITISSKQVSVELSYDYYVSDLDCIEEGYDEQLTLLKDQGILNFEYDTTSNYFKQKSITGFKKHGMDSVKLESILQMEEVKFTQLFYDQILSLEKTGNSEQKKVIQYLKQDSIWNELID